MEETEKKENNMSLIDLWGIGKPTLIYDLVSSWVLPRKSQNVPNTFQEPLLFAIHIPDDDCFGCCLISTEN